MSLSGPASALRSFMRGKVTFCSDETPYPGFTTDLDYRIKRHKKDEVNYTKQKLPVNLIIYVVFKDEYKDHQSDRYLKSGSVKASGFKFI